VSLIKSVGDLASKSIEVAGCAPAVPCGAYSGQVLKKARVTVQPVSEETSVSSVVTKVSLGEADAGIAYTTDVKAGGSKIAGVPIPASQNVTADDPVVQLKDAPNSAAAALAHGTRWPGCWRAGSSAARPCCASWPRCR
jgi:molybdate transport system substrate-binding protein